MVLDSVEHCPLDRKHCIIFDFDNTLVDTSGVSKSALKAVKDYIRDGRVDYSLVGWAEPLLAKTKNILVENETAFGDTFGKLIQGEDPQGLVDVDEWRVKLWQDAACNVGASLSFGEASYFYKIWKETRLRYLSISESVQVMLTELGKEYKLCLITNGNTVVQTEKIKKTGIETLFDLIVISGDHPWEKPDKKIFEFAAMKLGFNLNSAVMIGDNWDTDIQGGLNAGMKALIWINNCDKDCHLKRMCHNMCKSTEESTVALSVPASWDPLHLPGNCYTVDDVLQVPEIVKIIHAV